MGGESDCGPSHPEQNTVPENSQKQELHQQFMGQSLRCVKVFTGSGLNCIYFIDDPHLLTDTLQLVLHHKVIDFIYHSQKTNPHVPFSVPWILLVTRWVRRETVETRVLLLQLLWFYRSDQFLCVCGWSHLNVVISRSPEDLLKLTCWTTDCLQVCLIYLLPPGDWIMSCSSTVWQLSLWSPGNWTLHCEPPVIYLLGQVSPAQWVSVINYIWSCHKEISVINTLIIIKQES